VQFYLGAGLTRPNRCSSSGAGSAIKGTEEHSQTADGQEQTRDRAVPWGKLTRLPSTKKRKKLKAMQSTKTIKNKQNMNFNPRKDQKASIVNNKEQNHENKSKTSMHS
jgi:hypothetical protein